MNITYKLLIGAGVPVVCFGFWSKYTQHPHSEPTTAVMRISLADVASHPMPPTVPLALKLERTDQGVKLSWLASVAGAYPLGGYMVFRRHLEGLFYPLSTVPADSLSYTDPDAQPADTYHIESLDTQIPVQYSGDSINVSFVDNSVSVVSGTTPVESTPTPSEAPVNSPTDIPTPLSTDSPNPSLNTQIVLPTNLPSLATTAPAAEEQVTIDRMAQTADSAVRAANNKPTEVGLLQLDRLAANYADTLQNPRAGSQPLLSQPAARQLSKIEGAIFSSFPSASTQAKSQAVNRCANQHGDLENALNTLDETAQNDVYLALAFCSLIEEYR